MELDQDTSQTKKYKECIRYPPKRSELGQTQEKSNVVKRQAGNDFMTLGVSENSSASPPFLSQMSSTPGQELFTPVSRPSTKKKTCVDKSKSYTQHIPHMKSSKKLPRDSTSNAGACSVFSVESSKERSRKLWLPTKIASQDSDSISSSGFSKAMTSTSWFTTKWTTEKTQVNSPKTSWLSQRFSWLDKMEDEVLRTEQSKQVSDTEKNQRASDRKEQGRINKARGVALRKFQKGNPLATKDDIADDDIVRPMYKEETPLKTHKVPVKFNKLDKTIINQWLGVASRVYNQCVHDYNSNGKTMRKIGEYRQMFINSDNMEIPEFYKSVPYEVKDCGILDFKKAVESNKAKAIEKTIRGEDKTPFDIKYRDKRKESRTFAVLQKGYKKNGFYPLIMNKCRKSLGSDNKENSMKSKNCYDLIPSTIEHDARLIRDKLNRYWFCYQSESTPITKSNHDKPKAIAFDPGVRTFMTGYDPDGLVFEVGNNDMTSLFKRGISMDITKSKMSKCNARKRWKLKRALLRTAQFIKNRVDEVHCKTTKWVSDNYDVVMLPKFETSKMVKRGERKIGSKTARQMMTWSHYRFQQRMKNKLNDRLVIVDESYTSKTCGSCFKINHKLGGNKVFTCSSCGLTIDRDINGARNIFLKNMSLIGHVLRKPTLREQRDCCLEPFRKECTGS